MIKELVYKDNFILENEQKPLLNFVNEQKLINKIPNQVIINEYQPDQGIR